MPYRSRCAVPSIIRKIHTSPLSRSGLIILFAVISSACSSTNSASVPAAASPAENPSTGDQTQSPADAANPLEPIPLVELEQTPSGPSDLIEIEESEQPGNELPEIPVSTENNAPNGSDISETPTSTDASGASDIAPAQGAPTTITQAVTQNAASASCTSDPADIQVLMLELINEARATARSCGADEYGSASSLSWNTTLENTARAHSADMASVNFFDHTGSDGSSIADRVSRAGYAWRAVGENIAAGRNDAEQTLDDWLESPGHCRNIMNPAFTEVAVTCVEDNGSDFQRYWTNVLAAPR